MIRKAAFFALVALSITPARAASAPDYVQAVEFPYYLYPRTLWERELVWLKTIGIRTVEFSIPWNWHEPRPGEYDFTGRTSPRRDLTSFVRLLRKLEMRAWVRPLPPVAGWLNGGLPSNAAAAAQRAWIKQLEQLLAPQTVSHGGPIAYVEGRTLAIDAPAPPAPVTIISANNPAALARSREAMATARGSLLWTDVEDALYPAGWAANPTVLLRKGAVGLGGEERAFATALRREAALLRNWSGLLGRLQRVTMPKPAAGKLPEGVSAVELTSPAASVVAITNTGKQPFQQDLRVLEPASKRTLVLPGVHVPAGESLWLPVGVSIGPNGLCRECTNFSGAEHIVYATAELLSIEYENGILAMEFAAPETGEAVLQFARRPVGPFLAGGKPAEFDWDEKTLRARFRIPASKAAGYRMRIGIAIEEPDTSAFFNEARRLVIGQKNSIATTYSSEELANRSRLRLPEGFTATAERRSPNEIDYTVTVPAGALHGDFANLAIEADGVPLGRARPQLFRPLSIYLPDALQMHFGSETELTPEPFVAAVEPRAGSSVEVAIRNNAPAIQTFRLEASGEGLEFFPPKAEISVGGMDERRVSFRIFGGDGAAGLRDARLRVSGAATLEQPVRILLLPRGRTVAWTADLDGDGLPEWILESQRARAVFSAQDGGRWMEFTWKDTDSNVLPEQGLFAAPGAVEVKAAGDALEFSGKGWKRTVRLAGAVLTVEQSTPLPPEGAASEKRGNVEFTVERASATRAVYTLK